MEAQTEEAEVRVTRSRGRCERCGADPVDRVEAYDPRVYLGAVCAGCVLEGRASDRYGPDHAAMRPMVFVARGLRGEEPFRTLLLASDVQGGDPGAARALAAQLKAAQERDAAERKVQRQKAIEEAQAELGKRRGLRAYLAEERKAARRAAKNRKGKRR